MGTKAYFFEGDSYVRYDRGDDRVDDGYPLKIADTWVGTAASDFGSSLDTALNLEVGVVYFFRGANYVRYKLGADEGVDFGPALIADHWPGMAERGFDRDVDAALNYGNGFAYFFKGANYVRYKLGDGEGVDQGPISIGAEWNGMTAVGFDSDLDAAINWGNGKTFFFKGGNYVRYDMTNDVVDPGYPLPIADQWPGMATAGFATRLSAAVDIYDGRDVWLPSARRNAPPVNGPQFIALPWRGVLHTTEGGTLSGAEQAFAAGKDWPNLAIDPDRLDIVEYYPLSRGARALTDNLTPQNAARCVQIEIVGLAQESPDWAPERLAFIRDVMRQIEDLVPIPRTTDRTFLDLAGVNHNPGNRMSVDEWKRFSGWCGHQHVPGNTHWDPGAIDIDTLLKT